MFQIMEADLASLVLWFENGKINVLNCEGTPKVNRPGFTAAGLMDLLKIRPWSSLVAYIMFFGSTMMVQWTRI